VPHAATFWIGAAGEAGNDHGESIRMAGMLSRRLFRLPVSARASRRPSLGVRCAVASIELNRQNGKLLVWAHALRRAVQEFAS